MPADFVQFSKMSDRQLGLWETGGLKNLDMQSLDSSACVDLRLSSTYANTLSGVLMPFFAEGNDVLFLAGKG